MWGSSTENGYNMGPLKFFFFFFFFKKVLNRSLWHLHINPRTTRVLKLDILLNLWRHPTSFIKKIAKSHFPSEARRHEKICSRSKHQVRLRTARKSSRALASQQSPWSATAWTLYRMPGVNTAKTRSGVNVNVYMMLCRRLADVKARQVSTARSLLRMRNVAWPRLCCVLSLGAREEEEKKKKRQREVLTPLPEARQPDEAPEQRSLNEQRDESGEDSHRLQRERAVLEPFLYHLQITS